jgi:nitrogen regulatory protein PII 2
MLIPKRMMSLVVPDEAAPKVIETIIRVNRTGNRGDGKIFVLSIEDAVRVRTGERAAAALA